MIDDKDSAAYYQDHKDDASEWGAPVKAPASASRRLASMISVRFAPDEVESIRVAAAAQGDSLSQFVRQAALARAGHAKTNVSRIGSGTVTGIGGTVDLLRRSTKSGYDTHQGGNVTPPAAKGA
jgi:hypothetical protein